MDRQKSGSGLRYIQEGNCKTSYRMIVLRKTIKVTKGELKLFNDIRYFFYIANDMKMSVKDLVKF